MKTGRKGTHGDGQQTPERTLDQRREELSQHLQHEDLFARSFVFGGGSPDLSS